MSRLITSVVLRGQLSNSAPPLLAALDAYRRRLGPQVRNRSARPAAPPARHGAARRLGDTELKTMIAGYQGGSTTYELAAQLGVHRHTISDLLKRAGVPLRRRSMTTDEITQAVQLYAEDKSLVRVGEILGFDHGTIYLALRRTGVRIRDTHGRER